MDYRADIAVIGGGPGGYVAAIKAAQAGSGRTGNKAASGKAVALIAVAP